MQTTYDFYSDPGHGWLKVKKDELHSLGIFNLISGFSYERYEWAYLEEDQDATTFRLAKEDAGERHQFRCHYARVNDSRIRKYKSFIRENDNVYSFVREWHRGNIKLAHIKQHAWAKDYIAANH